MKRIAVLAGLAGCIATTKIQATSDQVLNPSEAETTVSSAPLDAATLVIDKLGARGFTVIASRRVEGAVRIKLAGNRDFSGVHTLGSVFYAWLDPVPGGTKIRLVGKPTLDHVESCPTLDNEPTCSMVETEVMWGLSGVEEARVIRGVFAELELQGEVGQAPEAEAAAEDRGLSVHHYGKQLRWNWSR